MKIPKRKIIAPVLATAVVIVVWFSMSLGMNMRNDGTMTGCVFDQATTCPMNYEEHVDHWQQTVLAVLPSSDLLRTALFATILIGAAWLSLFGKRQSASKRAHTMRLMQSRRERIAKWANYLLQALANGILHPRIYNILPSLS